MTEGGPVRRDARDRVYRRLRELITRGNLAPGARVRETEVAERLGVSRTPVRAATQRLVQEGYLASEGDGRRRSSPVVSPLTESDARELFTLVGAVEGVAGRSIAGQGRDARARVGSELGEANEALRELAGTENPDPDGLFDLDWRFHHVIVRAGSGPRLRKVHARLKPQTERYVRTYMYGMRSEFVASLGEHERIIEAIASGDGDETVLAVARNWSNAAERLGRIVAQLGERGVW